MPSVLTQDLSLLPGISDCISDVNERIMEFASDDAPVLLSGEPGTEKAFVAKLIHQHSQRRDGPLLKLSVSWKLPADMAEHVQRSQDGSLIVYLQRDFPPDMQYSILEIAGDGVMADPMTGDLLRADARIILIAGHQYDRFTERNSLLPELQEMLSPRRLEIPPIRERSEDIPALVRYATRRARETGRTQAKSADPQVLALFRQWHWPKNAEDLLLITAEAALNTSGELITLADLPEHFLNQVSRDVLDAARNVRVTRQSQYTPMAVDSPTPMPQIKERTPQVYEVTTDREDSDARDSDADYLHQQQSREEEEAEAEKKRVDRLVTLAKRLNAQSQLLQRQIDGPLEGRIGALTGFLTFQMPEQLTEEDEAIQTLETELDRGLDSILALRRQLAKLNRREADHLSTVRDLYTRLMLVERGIGSAVKDDESRVEALELTKNLRLIGEAILKVKENFPELGKQLEVNFTSALPEKEATTLQGLVNNGGDMPTEQIERPNELLASESTTQELKIPVAHDEEETRPPFELNPGDNRPVNIHAEETGPLDIESIKRRAGE
ncbi:MAG: sigma 54-interacting transcriptional regulator [Sumerlaeia bacterium]